MFIAWRMSAPITEQAESRSARRTGTCRRSPRRGSHRARATARHCWRPPPRMSAVTIRPATAARSRTICRPRWSRRVRTPAHRRWRGHSRRWPRRTGQARCGAHHKSVTSGITKAITAGIGSLRNEPPPIAAKTLADESDDLPFGDQLGEPAPGDHQDQGGDDGLDLEAATRNPFQSPQQRGRRQAAIPAAAAADRPAPIEAAAVAPAIAMTAPTERSMPRVAMTRVMPSARRDGAPRYQHVDEAAEERPSWRPRAKKSRKTSQLTKRTRISAASCGDPSRAARWTGLDHAAHSWPAMVVMMVIGADFSARARRTVRSRSTRTRSL